MMSDETMGFDGSCKQILLATSVSSSSTHGGPTMISNHQTSSVVISSPVHSSRKLDKTMEALSLVSIRALFALLLWYLFSFGAIFLNKYVVDLSLIHI